MVVWFTTNDKRSAERNIQVSCEMDGLEESSGVGKRARSVIHSPVRIIQAIITEKKIDRALRRVKTTRKL